MEEEEAEESLIWRYSHLDQFQAAGMRSLNVNMGEETHGGVGLVGACSHTPVAHSRGAIARGCTC